MRQERLFDIPEDATCPVCGRDLPTRPDVGRVVICSGCRRGITEHPRTGRLKPALDVLPFRERVR